jgi:hypothetical protein
MNNKHVGLLAITFAAVGLIALVTTPAAVAHDISAEKKLGRQHRSTMT